MRLTRLGLNLSMAFLKKGLLESGWLVTLTGFVKVAKFVLGIFDYVAVVEDFKPDLLRAAFYNYFALWLPFENFFNKGLLCCCSSVKTGFWAKTRDCVSFSNPKMAKN